MISNVTKTAAYSLVALSLSISTSVTFARGEQKPSVAKQMTLSCAGKSTTNQAVQISTCVVVRGEQASACKGATIKAEIDGALDYEGYAPNISGMFISSPDSFYVVMESLNDGLETHSKVEYDSVSPVEYGSWNVMKLQSVKTGKRLLVTDFKCSLK